MVQSVAYHLGSFVPSLQKHQIFYSDVIFSKTVVMILNFFFILPFFPIPSTFSQKMKPIPTKTTNLAIKLLQDGQSTREVAKTLNISKSAAANIYKDNRENMPVNKGGRPRKISDQTVQHLKVGLKRGQFRTAVQAHKEAVKLLKDPISVKTVRRRLKEAGLIAKKVVKRPAPKKQHVKGRLQFMRKYGEWTVEDWANVVFSDESKINRICSDGIRWVWDDQPGRLNTRTVQGTVKFGGGNVMVWSCMSWHGPGYIAKIDETMDSQLYIQILKEDLQLSVEEWGISQQEFIFQHDNDPKHTAKVTKAYLEEVNLTEEAGRLLYPIEHMWAYLKMQLAKYPTPPKSAQELWERVSTEWYKIPVEYCRALIKSMPRRINAVFNAKGRHTKY
jgi:transposase